MAKFKIGDKVKAVSASHGWGDVNKGDIGKVVEYADRQYRVDFKRQKNWWANPSDLVLASTSTTTGEAFVSFFLSKLPSNVFPATAEKVEKKASWLMKAKEKSGDIAGCRQSAVDKILTEVASRVTDDEEESGIDPIKVEIGTIVVPLKRENGHDYALNQPCMIIELQHDSCVAIKMNGTEGNFLPVSKRGYVEDCRYPTRAELDKFVASKAVQQFAAL